MNCYRNINKTIKMENDSYPFPRQDGQTPDCIVWICYSSCNGFGLMSISCSTIFQNLEKPQ